MFGNSVINIIVKYPRSSHADWYLHTNQSCHVTYCNYQLLAKVNLSKWCNCLVLAKVNLLRWWLGACCAHLRECVCEHDSFLLPKHSVGSSTARVTFL